MKTQTWGELSDRDLDFFYAYFEITMPRLYWLDYGNACEQWATAAAREAFLAVHMRDCKADLIK